MNIETLFTDIHSFLVYYQKIVNEEILIFFPSSMKSYQTNWIKSLQQINSEDLLDAYNGVNYSPMIDSSLSEILIKANYFYNQIKSVTPQNSLTTLPPRAYVGMKEKKRHEIDNLRSSIVQICNENSLNGVIDIGGGVGHLPRILAQHHGIESLSIDQDKTLQQQGVSRSNKYPVSSNAAKISFINATLNKVERVPIPSGLDNLLLVGLHTCGPLANILLSEAIKNSAIKAVLNFGCCYLKLDGVSDINISQLAKKTGPINLSKYALTLATRSHASLTTTEFNDTKRVKDYRYSFHLLLNQKLGINDFLATDNVSMKIYAGSFEDYAISMLNRLNITSNLTKKELQDFYLFPETKKIVSELFIASIIRWQFGKIIELYILLDRALYLKENGFLVTLYKYFEGRISPRNIGILGILPQK